MAAFKFFLIGSGQAPVLDVDADDLDELSRDLNQTRFLRARMVEIDGDALPREVLVPVGRIQMIAEVE